jgi:ribonuclease HI
VKVTIHIDGGSRGNPGPAAAGVVITDADGNALKEAGIYIGKATNNVAEYSGLVEGLKAAAVLGASEVDVFSDSELVIKQMLGEYRVKNPGLQPLFAEAKQFARSFETISFTHVRRENNVKADALVNMALDCQQNVGDDLI